MNAPDASDAIDARMVLIAHVPGALFGAAQRELQMLEREGVEVVPVNPSYGPAFSEEIDWTRHVGESIDAAVAKGRTTLVVLSGWGSRPEEADEALVRIVRQIRARRGVGLVILNNASPIPPGFPGPGRIAWPDVDDFADHVTRTAGIPPERIVVWRADRPDREWPSFGS